MNKDLNFPYYTGYYVNDDHPNVAADKMIAYTLIEKIDTMNVWDK